MTRPIYVEAPPSPWLATAVRCFWSIEGMVPAGGGVDRVLPDGCMDIIWDVSGSMGRSSGYVVGTMRQALVVRHNGAIDLFGVRFQPGAAAGFLGIPAPELTGLTADICNFWPGAAHLDALAAASVADDAAAGSLATQETPFDGGQPDEENTRRRTARSRLRSRIRHIEELLFRRPARSIRPAPLTAHEALIRALVQRIEVTAGGVPVSELESLAAVSPRTLTRRFTAAVGVTPKLACRVARMQKAAALIRQTPTGSLSRIAVTAGYYDQAHFTRDFGELAGITPAGYARERTDGFVQDTTATAS